MDCVSEVKGRWKVDDYYRESGEQAGEIYCKWLGQMEDIDLFDPLFFNISPAEARLMDPQHRVFMEECWKALEDGGFSTETLRGLNCGTYVGIMGNEYNALVQQQPGLASSPAHLMTGNAHSIFAARLAYLLNLKGPAIAVDTACSSSLVATHLACQALLREEVDMAIAGGVSLYLDVEGYRQMCGAWNVVAVRKM